MRVSLALAILVALVAATPARAQLPGVNGDLVYEHGGGLWVVGTAALVDVPEPDRLARDGRDPAWSARASRLAYSARRERNSDIWAMNIPAAGSPQQLTSDPAADTSPTWSAGGGWIAFTSRRGGTSDVWVMRADGTAPRAVASGPAVERQPAWSPDGSRIAFAGNRSGSHAIWVMRPDGSDARLLATVGSYAADPTWSPDGKRIAFAAGSAAATGIVTVDAATGADARTITSLDSGDRSPAWSPDGLQILYTHRGRSLRFADAAGVAGARAAPADEPTRVRAGRNAAWGPLPPPSEPQAGDSVIARPTDDIMVQVPGSEELVPLAQDAQLPVDTLVDTGDAAVDIVAAGPAGEDTAARLSGRFTYTQNPDDLGNELQLSAPANCAPGIRASAAAVRYDTGFISVKRPGPWRARGPHTKGAARRTAWYMKITCEKEITVVVEGVVDVQDPDFPFPIAVAAGQCYVSPSPDGRPLAGNCDVGSRVVPPGA